jgi:lysophosphatidate acyltransferase
MEILQKDEGCVIVSNHKSSFDILGFFWIWRYFYRMAAIAKKEIFYVWPFGFAAYLAGVVYIDRADSKKAKQQLEETSR